MRAILLAGCLLAGCAGRVAIPREVPVPVAVACVDQATRDELEAACPRLRTDAELLALDDYKVIQALRLDRTLAAGCIAALKPALELCAKSPAVASPPPLSGRRD